MATQTNLPFSWEQVDSLSDLNRLRLVLDALPDAEIIEALCTMRAKGRNDYPVAAMWRALVAGIVFGHPSIESLIRELNRNSTLLAVCGFNPLPMESRSRYAIQGSSARVTVTSPPLRTPAPTSSAFSRFLSNVVRVEKERGLISKMIETMRKELMELLADFGENLGYDGKAVRNSSTGRRNRKTGETSDPGADWGKHRISGIDSAARTWTKIKSWFGYRLHIIADTKYEIPVALSVTRASVSEVGEMDRMTEGLFAQDPGLAKRCMYLSADRGLDSSTLKKKLWDSWRIRPVIDNRELWREEKQNRSYVSGQRVMRPLGSVHDNVFYTERAELWCRCPVSGTERRMAFWGSEQKRGVLKFRCPAAAFDLSSRGGRSVTVMLGVRPGVTAGSSGCLLNVTVVFLLPPRGAA